MKNAKSVMTENPKCIQAEEMLVDTVSVFFKNNIHFAPVMTEKSEILGLLSEVGLLKASLRHYMDPGKHERVIDHKDLLEGVPFVKEDTKIQDVIRTMIQSSTKRVLVHNDRTQLVGIISPKDILRKLHGQQNLSNGMSYEIKQVETKANTGQVGAKNMDELVHMYREAFESSPLLMHSVDRKGKIVMANRKIHAELGYNVGELIGKTIFDLYKPTAHQEASHGLETIIKKGFSRSTMTEMVKKNGGELHVDIVSSALRDGNGSFLSTISVSRVIDSSKDLLDALQELGE